MTPPVFFAARDELLGTNVITLSGEEGRYASVVRRLRGGEPVQLTDGQGLLVEARVTTSDRTSLTVAVTSRATVPEPTPTMTVVQAIPKGDRGELAVELMTEAGVDVIVPWAAARSVPRWREDRAAKGQRKWQQSAQAAARQSRRSWWPEVAPVATVDDVRSRVTRASQAFVLHEGATVSLRALLTDELPDVLVVVGPEGGITDEELDAFLAAGARPARLGPTVLRSSTAGVVAAAVALSASARWSTEPDANA